MRNKRQASRLIEDLIDWMRSGFDYDEQARPAGRARVLLLEAVAVVELAGLPDSIVRMVSQAVAELSANSGYGAEKFYRNKEVVMDALHAARRWIDVSGDGFDEKADAYPSPSWPDRLETDIDRVMFKRLGSMWTVRILVAILAVAAIFGVFGAIHIGGLQVDLIDKIDAKEQELTTQIERKRDTFAVEFGKAQASLEKIQAELKSQKGALDDNKNALGDLTGTARKMLDTVAGGESQQIAQAGDIARKAIDAQRDQVAGAIDRQLKSSLDDVIAETRESAPVLLQQRINALMDRESPGFQKQFAKTGEDLNELERRLRDSDGKHELILASLRALGTPDAGFQGRLAAMFGVTVKAVYVVLALLSALLIANVAVLVYAWRSSSRKKKR
ncbi:MAG TPA: hypothetical protein VJ724_03915 [Tahibacter sp.]|nr:hypothetical protein [Tahibacter sp.]